MENMTNSAGTKDWLEATKGVPIWAYVEPQFSAALAQAQPFSGGESEAESKGASRRQKAAPASS